MVDYHKTMVECVMTDTLHHLCKIQQVYKPSSVPIVDLSASIIYLGLQSPTISIDLPPFVGQY